MASAPARILVIDDDPAAGRLLRVMFAAEGWEVAVAADGESGLKRALTEHPDLLVLDLQLPGMDGLEVLDRVRMTCPALPVVVLTAYAEVRTAVRATRLGAFDYLTKPVDADELTVTARRALEMRDLRAEVGDLRRQVAESEANELEARMGSSPIVHDVVEHVRTVAATDFSVLIVGETGTGKELVAQALHRYGERRAKPFLAVDCGAIPDALLESELFGHERGAFTGADRRKAGQFQLAEGGTLFLDEVGNLPLALQAKLLRVLESRRLRAVGSTETRPVDVRFVAATNQDLQERVNAGQFRADLYFRLAQYTVSLPPLRERPEDVPHLAGRFLQEVSVELRRPVQGISPEAIAALQRHPWPGNVRELRNVIRRAVLQSKDLVLEQSLVQKLLGQPAPAPASAAGTTTGQTLREVAEEGAREAERRAITATLRASHGNKSQAARALRTDYKTLHVKMKRLGIRARDFQS